MYKYLCKAKLREDEESSSFQTLFVNSSHTAPELAFILSKKASWNWHVTDFIGEVTSAKPYYGFALRNFEEETMELVKADDYFMMREYVVSYVYGHHGELEYRTVTDKVGWEVEIIRIDNIHFLEV